MLNPLPVVLADIRRSRTGFLAVVGLIAVAVALGVAVSAQERALRRGSARAADTFDLVVGAPGSPTQLVLATVYLQPAALPLVSGEVLRRLQQEPGAAAVAPIAFGDRFQSHPVIGTAAPFIVRLGIVEGRPFATPHEAVVGAGVALGIGGRFAPTHGRANQRALEDEADHDHPHSFEHVVVGRLPKLGTPWDQAILVPVEAVWAIHGLPSGHGSDFERIGPPWDGKEIAGVPAIVVQPRSVGDAYRLRGKYRTGGTTALFPAEVLVELYALLGDARDLLAYLAVATQALVIAAILLAVFASLALRRRQLAVLRALGASRAYVFSAVWSHLTLMITLGAGLGLLLGWAGATALSAALSAKTGVAMAVALAPQEIAMAGAVICVGMLLAVIPSWASYRQSVAAGLRG